jgi:hypothetical protein
MIEVKITLGNLLAMEPDAAEMIILGKLRDSGIPVEGLFHFRGVEHGTLYQEITFDGSLHYMWREEDEWPAEEK